MIRFDQTAFEFVPPSGLLTLHLREEKNQQLTMNWMITGRLGAVGAPMQRGNFAGERWLDFQLATHGGAAQPWPELTGQIDERTENWEISKAVLLSAADDDHGPKLFDVERSGMSMRHHFQLGPRRGYHFMVEGEALFLPRREASQVVFGGTDATQDELEAVTQTFTILEHLPLARVSVAVPLNASDRIAFARNLARRAAGFEDLEPWPGREPDFVPLGRSPEERPSENSPIHFITPWARDTEA